MNIWKFVGYIFSRPTLAAGIVGTSIHALMGLNQHLLLGINYWRGLSGNIQQSPIYGVLQIIIPYLVPFLVTIVGRTLRIESEIISLQKFPHANPNLVLKVNSLSQVQFMNRATESLLEEIGLSSHQVNTILPKDAPEIVKNIIGTDFIETRQSEIAKCIYEFQFRSFANEDEVFISGRNITKQLALEAEQQDSFNHLVELGDFADFTFSHFDPLKFDVQSHYQEIINLMLRQDDETHFDKPTHCLLVFNQDDGTLAGHIYTRHKNEIIQDHEKIIIDPKQSKVAVTYGKDQVVWSNWEQEKESLDEYQSHFHERVRAKVGTIKAFITYTSDEVALIGFYKDREVNQFDAQVLKSLTIYTKSLKLLSDQARDTEDAFIYTIGALARAAEENDEDTGEHIVRINQYAKSIALALRLDAEFVRKIHFSAQMHDVGKVHISPEILRKSSKLTDEEFIMMSEHPAIGARILGDSPRLEMAREIALCHHEKYDGSGYPNGIVGEDIPLAARIVTISDVYDALRQKRSYKPAYSHEKACDIINNGDGRVSPKHFDPIVLKTFNNIKHQMEQIFDAYQT